MGSALIEMGDSVSTSVLLTILSITFTYLFRSRHRLVNLTLVLPQSGVSEETARELVDTIYKKTGIPKNRIEFEESKPGSTRIVCIVHYIYGEKIQNAFYNEAFEDIHRSFPNISIVDVEPDKKNYWLNITFHEWLQNDFDNTHFFNPEKKQNDDHSSKPINWNELSPSIQSLLNRSFALACKSLCISIMTTKEDSYHLFLIWSLMLAFALPLSAGASDGLNHPGIILVYISFFYLLYMDRILRHLTPWTVLGGKDSKSDVVGKMALTEIKLLIESISSVAEKQNTFKAVAKDLERIAMLEKKLDEFSSVKYDELKFKRSWATVVRQFTPILKNKIKDAPWDSLMSKPVYQRFSPEYSAELARNSN